MDKLSNLLNILKGSKLNKSYDRIITDLVDIKSALSVVNEEVNDAILVLLSEGKYEEVNKLTSIPAVSANVMIRIENLLNGFVDDVKIDEEVKSVEVSKVEKVQNEEKVTENKTLQYSGIITSVKGLKVGAKVTHKTFGIGKIISLEDMNNGNGKLLKVNFDSCGEKPFNCTPEILEKYFGITEKEDESSKEGNLEIPENLINLFRKIEGIILRQDMKIVKEEMSVYNKYILNGRVLFTISSTNKALKMCFNIPYGKMVDTKNLLEDVSKKGHHGIGPYRLKIDEQTSFIDIENFAKQTYSYYKMHLESLLNSVSNNNIKNEPIKEEVVKKVSNSQSKEKGYNLYTHPNFFKSTKLKKIRIFGEDTEVTHWTDAIVILLKYLYLKDSNAFLNLREMKKNRMFSTSSDNLRRPLKIVDDLYLEGDKYPTDFVVIMASISEQYLNVFNKDVRKNVEFFIKE